MKTFETWHEANAFAQKTADETGLSLGIESPTAYRREWLVRYIPGKEFRFGYDTQCEAVEPTILRDSGAR